MRLRERLPVLQAWVLDEDLVVKTIWSKWVLIERSGIFFNLLIGVVLHYGQKYFLLHGVELICT